MANEADLELVAVPTTPAWPRRAPCPVIGIGQTAYHVAALAISRFSVITALETDLTVATARVPDEIGIAAQGDDTQSVVPGCAGMSRIPVAAPPDINVCLRHGMAAAACVAVTLQ